VAAKQVKVADVDAGIFFCGRRIEMMRHGESSPKGLDARPKVHRSDAESMGRSSLTSSTSLEDFSSLEWKRSNSQVLIGRNRTSARHWSGTALWEIAPALSASHHEIEH
jgi:hypothetical protein